MTSRLPQTFWFQQPKHWDHSCVSLNSLLLAKKSDRPWYDLQITRWAWETDCDVTDQAAVNFDPIDWFNVRRLMPWHHRLTCSLSVIQSPGQVVTIPMEEQIDDLFLCVLLTTPLSSKAHFNHLEIWRSALMCWMGVLWEMTSSSSNFDLGRVSQLQRNE